LGISSASISNELSELVELSELIRMLYDLDESQNEEIINLVKGY
jgi:hypothetical protein